MQNRDRQLLLFIIPIFTITFFLTESVKAQSSVGLNMNFSTTIDNDFNSPNFGTEIELTYQNKFLHIKNGLYVFGRTSAFYQPKAFSGQINFATDVAQYDRFRYGGSVATGFYLIGPILHAELGVGISRHFIELNKIQSGMPPGIDVDFTPSPDRKSQQFNTFDFNFALGHEFTDSFLVRLAFRIQTPLKQDSNHRLSPSLGMMYNF